MDPLQQLMVNQGQQQNPPDAMSWLQSGMVGAPPARSFPDLYKPRLQKIQENRPSEWDPEIPPENLLGLVPGGMAGRLVAGAPKIATAALAGYYGLAGTDEAGGAPAASKPPVGNAEDIKKLQEELRAYGYQGTIDGIWKGETQRAYDAKQQADQLRIQQQGVEAQRASAQAQQRAAEAQLAQTQQQAEADRIKNEQREQGQVRYREAEGSVSPMSRLLRDYGTPVGVTVGAIAGPAARALVTRAAGGAGREATAMMGQSMKSTPERVGRMNEIWRQGGQGGAVPFTNVPGQKAGFTSNPNAAEMSTLFQPNKALNAATDVGVMGGFGAEAGATGYLAHNWEQELQKASEAASSDPSEINIGRLQQAKDNVAFYEALSNSGRAAIPSYLTASKFMKRPGAPNLSSVEAEKLKLEGILRRKSPGGRGAEESPLAPLMNGSVGSGVPPALGPSSWYARQVRQ